MHAIRQATKVKVCYIVLRACVVLHFMTRGQTKLGCQENQQRDMVIWGEEVVGAQSEAEASEGLGWDGWGRQVGG